MAEKVGGCKRIYFVPVETLDSATRGFGSAWNHTLAVVPAESKTEALVVLMERPDFETAFRFDPKAGGVREFEGERTIYVPPDGRIVNWREQYEFLD